MAIENPTTLTGGEIRSLIPGLSGRYLAAPNASAEDLLNDAEYCLSSALGQLGVLASSISGSVPPQVETAYYGALRLLELSHGALLEGHDRTESGNAVPGVADGAVDQAIHKALSGVDVNELAMSSFYDLNGIFSAIRELAPAHTTIHRLANAGKYLSEQWGSMCESERASLEEELKALRNSKEAIEA